MQAFTYSYPTKVYFGEGAAASALAQELPKAGRTVLLAYGGGSIKRSGIYDQLKGLLEQAGKEVVEFSGIMANPTYAKAQEGAALARRRHVDFILAVGGGSVIDCCKVIAAQAVLEEDIWQMEYQEGRMPSGGIPMGAVVTASGTGAEMNNGAVIQPVYYRHILKDAPEKFARFAQVVFGRQTAEEGLEALTAFIADCGLPSKLGQLRSNVEIIPALLRQVADSCNLIRTNPRTLTHDEVYQILCECL